MDMKKCNFPSAIDRNQVFQSYPSGHLNGKEIHSFFSFICTPAFPLQRVMRAAFLGGLEMPHGFQQPKVVPLAPHLDETKPCRRCNHITRSLVDLWTVFHVCSRQVLLHQCFLGHSGQVSQPLHLRYLHSEKWLEYQGCTNFTAALFEANRTPYKAHSELRLLYQSVYQSLSSAFRHSSITPQGTWNFSTCCSVLLLMCSTHWLGFVEMRNTSVSGVNVHAPSPHAAANMAVETESETGAGDKAISRGWSQKLLNDRTRSLKFGFPFHTLSLWDKLGVQQWFSVFKPEPKLFLEPELEPEILVRPPQPGCKPTKCMLS